MSSNKKVKQQGEQVQGKGKAQLWAKGEKLDSLMHALTVGNDYNTDRALVKWDCFGSAAHARMLAKLKLISQKDLSDILQGLKKILVLEEKGDFLIAPEQEDCHTAIEDFLTKYSENAGKRVHLARSRNDQIMLVMRLYLRASTLEMLKSLGALIEIYFTRYLELKNVELPGYTHFQPAMPSSFGLWLHAWIEALLECYQDGVTLLDTLDANPLGSGAGFGSSTKIDRAFVANLLGFSRVQRSVIDVNNSRGRYELRFVRWLCDITAILEKCACDLMLYTTREFGFVSLPNEMTTGSSIMPQKRNPDIVELLRARASQIRSCQLEIESLTSKLPSSYHRDFQYTKEPCLRAKNIASESLQMANLIIGNFKVHKEKLRDCMYTDLYATYAANREVAAGKSFRDAYRSVAEQVFSGTLEAQQLKNDFKIIAHETEQSVSSAKKEFAVLKNAVAKEEQRLGKMQSRLL